MNAQLFLERHLKPLVANLLSQANIPWSFRSGAQHHADLEIRIGKVAFVGEALLSRSSVHFNQKIDRLKALAAKGAGAPLLVAPAISPQRQEILRKQEINYLDLIGNAWIRAPSCYIDRQSKKRNAFRMREVPSPFSDKSSLILRIIMEDPEKYWGNNEIADIAHINAGWVSQVCRRLEELRYVVRSANRKLRIFRPQDVLEDWVEYYRLRKQKKYCFSLPANVPQAVMEKIKGCKALKEFNWLLSFHAGASILAPYASYREVHVYSEGLPASVDVWKNQLGLEEAAPAESNLILVEPYYSASHRHGMRHVNSYPVVSDIQLYLDLRTYPVRGEEQARHLFEKRIAPKWQTENADGRF